MDVKEKKRKYFFKIFFSVSGGALLITLKKFGFTVKITFFVTTSVHLTIKNRELLKKNFSCMMKKEKKIYFAEKALVYSIGHL